MGLIWRKQLLCRSCCSSPSLKLISKKSQAWIFIKNKKKQIFISWESISIQWSSLRCFRASMVGKYSKIWSTSRKDQVFLQNSWIWWRNALKKIPIWESTWMKLLGSWVNSKGSFISDLHHIKEPIFRLNHWICPHLVPTIWGGDFK